MNATVDSVWLDINSQAPEENERADAARDPIGRMCHRRGHGRIQHLGLASQAAAAWSDRSRSRGHDEDQHRKESAGERNFSFTHYRGLRDAQTAFVDIAAYSKLPGTVSLPDRADQITFEFVTGNYFPLLGVRPILGRNISQDDDVRGAAPVCMVSYAFWHSHFGADARAAPLPLSAAAR